MDKDAFLKSLQDWTNKVPLVILGSGASVPFKLPSMWVLGEHLKKIIIFLDKDDQEQFENFVTQLDKLKDLELALHEIHIRPKVLEAIIFKTWELVNKHDIEAYDLFVNNKTDFPLANLTQHLLSTSDKKLSIITTNYDRLAEYAASLSGAFICNGFASNYMGHFTNLIHQNNFASLKGFNGQVNIWKVHGSLDWFKNSEDQDIQFPLRHLLPADYKPSIITPGLTKYLETQLEPFRTILTQADSEIENAKGYLCIGYGFNDIHVQPKLIAQIKKHKPIIVITKELSTKTKQSIIDNKSNSYILIEEANTNDTRIYSSLFSGPEIIPNVSYWTLGEYLKLIVT